MKKRVALILAFIVIICTLSSCAKKNDTRSTNEDIEYTDIPFTDEMMDAVIGWGGEDARDFSFYSYITVIDDGDEENSQGSAYSFTGRKKNGAYYGKYSGISSALSFQIDYDFYYADGWTYQIYIDPKIEELNEYMKSESTEEQFLATFDGLAPVIASETDFASAAAQQSSTGVVTVTVTATDENTLGLFTGDVEFIAERNEVTTDQIVMTKPVITYAIDGGRLVGAVMSFDMQLKVDGAERVYQFDREITINAVGSEVEDIELPSDDHEFEIIGNEDKNG